MNRALSKTQQKNAARAATDLTETLLLLGADEIVQLPLSDSVREAIFEAQKIKAHGGLKRQRKYVAQLLRDGDVTAIEQALQPILAAKAAEKNQFKLAEQWRDRLLVEGKNALELFLQTYTGASRADIAKLVQQAQMENQLRKPPRAQRELFRVVNQHIADYNRQ